MKKERFFIVCLLVVVAILFYLLSISENYNDRLIRQIELKDSLSKTSTKKDSIFSKKTEEYAKVITKYVSDCNFKYGDKSITTAELLRMTNKAMKDVDFLRDSLDYFKKSNEHYKNLAPEYIKKVNSNVDTATAYRSLWNQVSKMYDIKGNYTTSENTITTSVERNKKIDSALVLLKYYRHKLSLDSAGTTWTIITDDDKKLKKSNKKGKN